MARDTKAGAGGCPYEQAGCLSRLTFWWISSLFVKALKRPLTEADLQTNPPWLRTDHQVDRISRVWPNIDEKTGRPSSTFSFALFRHSWKKLVLATVLTFICEGSKFSHPFLMALMTRYFRSPGEVGLGWAWGSAGLLLGTNLLTMVLETNCTYLNRTAAMQMRTTCSGLIYRKVLRMNTQRAGSPSFGHITALLSTDVERFKRVFYSCQALLVGPVLLTGFLVAEAYVFGASILAGCAFIVLFQLVMLVLGKLQAIVRKKSLVWTDRRAQLVSEVLGAMRAVKAYCWENTFAERARELRRQETRYQRYRIFLNALTGSLNQSAGSLVIYVLVVTSVVSGRTLSPAVIVQLISLIRMMEAQAFIAFPSSFACILSALVSVKRIEKFLLFDDNLVERVPQKACSPEDVGIELSNVTASWTQHEKEASPTLTLDNISLTLNPGELVAVIGSVGAGKTSLLLACLSELPLLAGGLSLRGAVAYVPQEAWVMPTSVQANIVLEGEPQTARYHQALRVCQLDQDVAGLPGGDQASVGEKGQALSGGQKARLNLARAVYRDADIYLLDDPLSAVDTKVATKLFDECICGALKTKLRVLVTHNVDYLARADRVVVMEKGRVTAVGSYHDLSVSIKLAQYVQPEKPADDLSPSTPPGEEVQKQSPDMTALLARWDRRQRELMVGRGGKKRGWNRAPRKGRKGKGDKQKLLDEERESIIGKWSERELKEEGGVSGSVYLSYFRQGLGPVLVPLLVITLALMTAAAILAEWWMTYWKHSGVSSKSLNSTLEMTPHTMTYNTEQRIMILSSFLAVNIIMGGVQSLLLACICTSSSRALYQASFSRVLRAPMRFFEKNSIGAVLNRFTRDTSFVDTKIPATLAPASQAPMLVLGYFVYICCIVPWAVVAALPIVLGLAVGCYYFINGIRDLKRIEASLRSPTFTHLAATLQGLPVIRAFGLQEEFTRESASRMDEHAGAWFLYLTSNRFLGLVVHLANCGFQAAVLVTTLLLPTHAGDAGPKGLAIAYTLFLTRSTLLTTTKFTALETYMTSVERLLQYSHLEQEAPEHTDVLPAPGWPQEGDLRLTDLCLRYEKGGPPALGPLTFHVHPGEKVGIVGRTGAGKSSIFASLLRMTEPIGSIRIDGLETEVLGLTDLRTNISVIPQDPVLFSGSLRDNLDPLKDYSDDDLWRALGQVEMRGVVEGLPGGLYTETGQGGGHFSSGQRQLLCLTRALLKDNKVILIDEATSSVDHITDSLIQHTLTKALAGKTVLSIAHRLNTVICYDKILVLDKGQIAQYAHPYELLLDESGLLHQMVRQAGDEATTQLTQAARTAYEAKMGRASNT